MAARPRTKALKANQLKGELEGDLAAYEKVGLFQRSVNHKTAYRYRGVLLRYHIFLGENPPSLAATYEFLGLLRKNAFDPSTLRVYRAALSGFHQWRGEELKFRVKVPKTSARYIPWEIVQRMLELASTKPHDELILRLMADAGLRRDEVVNLKLSNVEGSKLRFRGKGGKERAVPMTDALQKLAVQFSAGRAKSDSLVELGEKGVYAMVKRYGARAGMPEITPHDLRRAFGTHLMEITKNIRVVQEILGHSDVNTTQTYTAVTSNSIEEAIKKLNVTTGDRKTTGDSQTTGEKETVSIPVVYDNGSSSGVNIHTGPTVKTQKSNLCLVSSDDVRKDTLRNWGIPTREVPEIIRLWYSKHWQGRHDICKLFLRLRDDLVVEKIPFNEAKGILTDGIFATENNLETILQDLDRKRRYKPWENIQSAKAYYAEIAEQDKPIHDAIQKQFKKIEDLLNRLNDTLSSSSSALEYKDVFKIEKDPVYENMINHCATVATAFRKFKLDWEEFRSLKAGEIPAGDDFQTAYDVKKKQLLICQKKVERSAKILQKAISNTLKNKWYQNVRHSDFNSDDQ